MNANERRISELDGIRGLAALGVVIHHYHGHLHGEPLHTLLGPVYIGGYFFVDLFFVLSGFILAQVYAYERRYPTVRAAIVSRIARMYPLHLVTLFLVAVLQKVHVLLTNYCFIYSYNDWRHLLLNVFMLNDSGLQTGWSFNGPSWSISTEIIVNVVFLALALCSFRRSLLVGCVFVSGAIALDCAVGWTSFEPGLRPFNGLLRCFLSFGMGLLARAAYDRWRTIRMPGWTADIALAIVIGGCAYLFSVPDRPYTLYLLAVVCFPALILLSLRSRWSGKALSSRALVYLGQLSFSVYLVHFPLELVIRDGMALTRRSPPFDNLLVLIVYCACCIAASRFTWKYLEVPARRRIKQLI